MPADHLVDARAMEAPGPLHETLSELDRLAGGEFLRLLILRDPVLLYPLLTVQGYAYSRQPRGTGYEVVIWREEDQRAAKRVEGYLHGRPDIDQGMS